MEECTINFIFALVVGKSAFGNINDKRLLNHVWKHEPSVRFYVSLITDTYFYKKLMEAAMDNHPGQIRRKRN